MILISHLHLSLEWTGKMAFKIIKQFISTGQLGDPPNAERRVYVWRVTSGSYSGSDDVYDDHEEGYYGIDQLQRDDEENYQGWGELGDGRIYGLMAEISGSSGSYTTPTSEELRDGKLARLWRTLNPTVSDFSPKTASVGELVSITGSDFLGTAKIGVGWHKTKNLTIVDNEHITFTVPSSSETGFLTVYNYNQEFDKADGWIQISGTIIQSQSFTGGSTNSGSYYKKIEIYGNNFQYTKRVQVGDINVPRNTWVLQNNNQIDFYIPGNAITDTLKLYDFNNTIIETGQEFHVEPSSSTNIQTFYPTYGPPGDIIHVFGSHFLGVVSASIHTTIAEFEIVNDNHIRLTVPEGATTRQIHVQDSASVVYDSSEDYIWMPGISSKKAVIDDFNPKTGSIGATISVTGSNLLGTIGGYVVDTGSLFNNRLITIPDRNHITFDVPAGSTSGYFWVRNNIGLKRSSIPIEVI